MHPLLIACLAGFAAARHTYGRLLGRRGSAPAANGVFGGGFAAGAIVGPAIAVAWGWLPAVLWIVLGSVFVGAVQDLGASLLSRRGGGRTLGDVAGKAINRRARVAFLGAALVGLTLALSVFALVAAAVFKAYPAAIFACVVLAAAAAGMGIVRQRLGGGLALPCLGLAAVYAATFWGDAGPLHGFNAALAAWPTWAWAAVLLACALAAGSLPAAWYARPRNSVNALQLVVAMTLIVAGLVVASVWGGAPPVEGASRVKLEMAAPAWNLSSPGAPPLWPFLFVTITCGAFNGLHALFLQSGGETESRRTARGVVAAEAFLAVLAVLACTAGLGLGIPLTPRSGMTFATPGGGSGSIGPSRGWEAYYLHEQGSVVAAYLHEGQLHARGKYFVGGPIYFKPFGWGTGVESADQAGPLREKFGLVLSDDRRSAVGVGTTAFYTRYRSWQSAADLSAAAGAFVTGAGNLAAAVGLPRAGATALMAVLAASLAAGALDTAVRLQRRVVQELLDAAAESQISTPGFRISVGPYLAMLVAVAAGGVLAAVPASGDWTPANVGTGGLMLWPLFGAGGGILAGLALAVILFHLRRRKVVTWLLVPPMLFMLVMPAWSLMLELPAWWRGGRYILAGVGGLLLALETWMTIEAALLYGRIKGVPEETIRRRGFDVLPATPTMPDP